MSPITRALTTRKVKLSLELAQEARERSAMYRRNTTKAAPLSHSNSSVRNSQEAVKVHRPKISAPVELVHTTNMLSYNAPDLPRPSTSSEASTKSDAESETSTPSTAASSPPTSPNVAAGEFDRCCSPEPNHLSCYFAPPSRVVNLSTSKAPAIPHRAPSHTKKASFEAVRRQRSASALSKESGKSLSTKASFTFSRTASGSTTASTMSQNSVQLQPHKMSSITPAAPTVPHASEKKYEQSEMHPFGQELAQVSEIAEEFGVSEKLDVIDEEEQELVARGLCKHSPDTYLRDIEGLASSFFHDRSVPHARPFATAAWI